jgi:hypothetical protein
METLTSPLLNKISRLEDLSFIHQQILNKKENKMMYEGTKRHTS